MTGDQVEKYFGTVLKQAPDRAGGAGRPDKIDFTRENEAKAQSAETQPELPNVDVHEE